MALIALLVFDTLSASQLPHDHMGHLFKKTQISEYCPHTMNLNLRDFRGGASVTGTSILTNVPDDSDTQSGLGTTALDSCLMMLLTTWKLNVIKVLKVGGGRCKNSNYIFQS